MRTEDDTPAGLLNLAAFLPKSAVNGPGLRAVVWVQGCPRRCPGCFNQDMLEFRAKELVPVADLTERILACPGIEGVAFSGGEPFTQAAALAELAESVQRHGLNVAVFTGYTAAELTAGTEPAWQRLLAATDLLIAGPYRQEQPSSRYLLGSANQELVFLSDKLRQHPDVVKGQSQKLEVIVDAAGKVIITGLDNFS